MTDAKQKNPPVCIVDASKRRPLTQSEIERMTAGDRPRFRTESGKRAMRVVTPQNAWHRPERLGDCPHRAGRRDGWIEGGRAGTNRRLPGLRDRRVLPIARIGEISGHRRHDKRSVRSKHIQKSSDDRDSPTADPPEGTQRCMDEKDCAGSDAECVKLLRQARYRIRCLRSFDNVSFGHVAMVAFGRYTCSPCEFRGRPRRLLRVG